MEKLKIEMIIERGESNLTARIRYNNNLIVDQGASVKELDDKLKMLLYDFEDIAPENVDFEYVYDVYALFRHFDFLNIGKVAERAGINPGLLRQYASQVKYPSKKQAQRIEDTIHLLAAEMMKALVYA